MNIIEKRKGQLKGLGIGLLVLGVVLALVGIVMTVLGAVAEKTNALLIVFGILIAILGVVGLVIGFIFLTTANAVKATNGSIAEENLGMGTTNMHKCSNCGVEIPKDRTICEKCEENLKP
ncbi:MAG: hypothetical protein IJX25_05240 [Clostridia bacterium]|nr:hypothetical protein [Clostridia bacterium]